MQGKTEEAVQRLTTKQTKAAPLSDAQKKLAMNLHTRMYDGESLEDRELDLCQRQCPRVALFPETWQHTDLGQSLVRMV